MAPETEPEGELRLDDLDSAPRHVFTDATDPDDGYDFKEPAYTPSAARSPRRPNPINTEKPASAAVANIQIGRAHV